MTSRLALGQDGRNMDEYLEVCFLQVYEWNIEGEQGVAVETMLQQYTTSVYGKSGVPCQGITSDLNAAILWVTQFGELRIEKVDAKTLKSLQKHNKGYTGEINFSGKVGPEGANQKRVYARTVHQIALLAGIQVLRETADGILNTDAVDTKH